MLTFHIIEAVQLRGSSDAEQFEDSVHRRYRFMTNDDSSARSKAAATSDDDLDTANVSDDVFFSSKPLYVYLYCIFLVAHSIKTLKDYSVRN